MKVLGLGLKSALSLWNLTSSPRLSSLPRAWFSLLHLVFANRWIYHVHRKRHRIWSHGERINTETSIKDSECRPCVCLPVPSTISSSFSVSWRFINYFLLVGYSPSHLPHSYYPCTTSIHVGYIRQMSSLVWLYLLVVSCNSLQECGSSQEATCLEPQVSLKNTIFAFFYRYTLVSYNNIKKGFKIPHTTIPILNTFFILFLTLLILAFASYGCFWMSYSAILIPGSGVIAAYSDPQELSNAIGLFLIVWFMFTAMLVYVYSAVAFIFSTSHLHLTNGISLESVQL